MDGKDLCIERSEKGGRLPIGRIWDLTKGTLEEQDEKLQITIHEIIVPKVEVNPAFMFGINPKPPDPGKHATS